MNVDLLLRRIERTAIVVCGLMTLAALVLAHGRPWPALGVLAGGLLAGLSYRMIASSAGTLAPETGGDAGPSLTSAVLQLVGRYALLALLAYVMIGRLRLHPLGLLAGASSVVAALSIEAVRFLLKKTP